MLGYRASSSVAFLSFLDDQLKAVVIENNGSVSRRLQSGTSRSVLVYSGKFFMGRFCPDICISSGTDRVGVTVM